jgi:cytochrome c oxidase subunit 3
MIKKSQRHSFHLVDPSPWPILSAIGALMLTCGGVMHMHGYNDGYSICKLGFELILFMMFFWWGDIIRESTYEGQHTASVQYGLRLGVIFFIASEIMFFFGFFWAFFHSSINPSFALGGVWAPAFLKPLSPWGIPLLNTILLLSSGFSVTWAHNGILLGSKIETLQSLAITIFLAIIFTLLQAFEYYSCSFNISDGVYGSTFFLATGFHGFHVAIGTIFLIVCLIRVLFNHFTKNHHFGFEAAAWYWHFVDVVWLFLFITIYWWGF